MALPAQTFPQHDMTSLLNYINTKIIPNGMELIIGEIHNNVENGLGQFILQSILNYYKATVISAGGAVVLSVPINYIVNSTPSSLAWVDDNWFNEFYIVNTTGSDINLLAGYSYFDEFVAAKTTIPANTCIHIAKTANGSWIKIGNTSNSSGGGSTTLSAGYLQFVVGDSPNNAPLNDGETTFTVTDTNVVDGSVMLFLSGQKMPINDPTQPYSYTIVYQPTGFTVAFYAGAVNGMQFELNWFKTAVPPSSAGLVGSVIAISGADFIDSTNYVNTALNNYYLQVLWNDISKMLTENTQWLYRSGGGVEIIYPGFDAAANPDYSLYVFVTGYMV